MTPLRNRIAVASLALVAAASAWMFVRARTAEAAPAPPPTSTAGPPRPLEAVASRQAGTAPNATNSPSRDVPPASTASAPVRVRLVDAAGRAPLPHYAVRLARDAGELADGPVAATDDRGELSLPPAWRGTALTLVALDDALTALREPQHVPIAANAWPRPDTVLELPLAVGPTYTLEFDSTPPPEPLEATLLPGTDPMTPVAAGAARIRSGDRPWVRLDPAAAEPARIGSGPWTLVVCAPSGWLAAGPVRVARGVQPDPVLLRRVPTGTLVVAPRLAGRPPDRAGLHATVQAVDATDTPTGPERTLAIDERSPRATFPRLPAGRYRVDVRGIGAHHHREIAEVRDGGTTTVVCDFAGADAPRPLLVIATSQTRTRELFTVAFVAKKVGGQEVAWSRWVRDEPGRKIHQFDTLSAGEWDVEVQPTPHLPPWATTRQRVAADAGTVEFTCMDANAPPPGYAAVRALDAATGRPLPGAGATSFVDGRQHLTTNGDANGVAMFGPYLAGRAFQVLVQAGGRVPRLVDVVATAGRAAAPHDVALTPGWGTMLAVRAPEPGTNGAPLAGVEVLADGAVLGTTDANGLLLLSLASRPQRLELRHPQWTPANGVDAATGAFSAGDHAPLVVTMRAKP
jgi:hypothetical protein